MPPPSDADLLAEARRRCGLSQRELARRARTSQAMVARVEQGRQSPSIATLKRLVEASGLYLNVSLEGQTQPLTSALESVPVPRPPEARTSPPAGRFLVVRIAGDRFGVRMDGVREVVVACPARRLPGRPAASVAGLVMVRGEVVVAIDAAHRLRLPAPDPAGRLVLVDVDGSPRGLLVEATENILVLEADAVSPPPAGADGHMVSGIGTTPDGLVLLLDLERMCEL
jgi:purine-binding chemotaxis protein CheW